MAISATSTLRTVDDYNASRAAEADRTSSVLGQDDFLKLMTTQLMNQDPLQPMENGEFLAQMAQFSTVSGINEMNTSVQGLAESYRSQQLMQAGALINKKALVAGNVAEIDAGGSLRGAFELTQATDGTGIVIRNMRGEIVHEEQMGILMKGIHEFTWDGITTSGAPAEAGQYIVEPVALDNGESYTPNTLVYADVQAISTGLSGELVLEVAGMGAVPFSEVLRVGE